MKGFGWWGDATHILPRRSQRVRRRNPKYLYMKAQEPRDLEPCRHAENMQKSQKGGSQLVGSYTKHDVG